MNNKMGNKIGVSIIGAGPSGSFAAYLLACQGFDVRVYEAKSRVGKKQCGGLVTHTLRKLHPIFRGRKFESTIVNKTSGIVINSENNSALINFLLPEMVLDRVAFDNFLLNKARDAGARFYLGRKFVGLSQGNAKVRFKIKSSRIYEHETDLLVGADGALSSVARACGISRRVEFAIESRVRLGKPVDSGMYQAWFDRKISPKFFGWLIPESSRVARIGMSNNMSYFERFLAKHKARVLDMRSGYVPFDRPAACEFGNVYFVGDAAGHVKASSGGGIVLGLRGAKLLASSLVRGESYEKNLKKLNRELYLHYMLSKAMEKFSNRDYDKVVRMFSGGRLNKLLSGYTRDEFSARIIKILFSEPRLLRFAWALL